MLQRFHWLIVPIGLLLFVSCTMTQGDEPVAATDSAESGSALVTAAATQPPPPTATPEGPLVTTSEPQSVEIGSGDSAEAQSNSKPAAPPEEPEVSAELDQPFLLGYEQTAYLATDELYVTFSAVLEDSRCPTDVDCVWSGAVTVELQLFLPEQPVETGTLRLVAGQQEGSGELLPGYIFSLIAVEPYPDNADQPTPLAEYVIELQIGTRPIRPLE